jgi:hypothetical protein
MELTQNNVQYKFIPTKVKSFEDIVLNYKILTNNVYEKYQAESVIEGELLICNNPVNISNKKIIKQTYKEYLECIKNRDNQKDIWFENILNGISEQDEILYKDNDCIIIPTYTWNGYNINKLHILALTTNKDIRCIRSLTKNHIPLLKHMKSKTLEIIKKKYNLDEHLIKMYFHYEPSTYYLHIHFVNHNYIDGTSSVEYSHDLDSVIFNLELDTNYYKKILLNIKVDV